MIITGPVSVKILNVTTQIHISVYLFSTCGRCYVIELFVFFTCSLLIHSSYQSDR